MPMGPVLPEIIYTYYNRKGWRMMSCFEGITSWNYFPEAQKILTVTIALSKTMIFISLYIYGLLFEYDGSVRTHLRVEITR